MEPNVKMDRAQFNKNVEMYGLEAAVSWISQYPNTIHMPLDEAFGWGNTKEGYDYWDRINTSSKGKTTTTSQPTPQPPTPQAPTEASSKLLPMEEEIQKRIDNRKALNVKNKAIHEKAIELAEASRKKLEKKLKQLMVANGVEVE